MVFFLLPLLLGAALFAGAGAGAAAGASCNPPVAWYPATYPYYTYPAYYAPMGPTYYTRPW